MHLKKTEECKTVIWSVLHNHRQSVIPNVDLCVKYGFPEISVKEFFHKDELIMKIN